MKLLTIHTSIGKGITIETSEDLDPRSHSVFMHAYKLAKHLNLNRIEVDLGKTQTIRDSGLAILLLLSKRINGESISIKLINCSPEIRSQLRPRAKPIKKTPTQTTALR
jgi:anti-anti-sigma regulatory factor